MSATCRSCGAPIVFCTLESGAKMPLDPVPVDDIAPSLVAKYRDRGRVIKATELEVARQWVAEGWTIHRSHFYTCPNAAAHRRRRPRQEAIDL